MFLQSKSPPKTVLSFPSTPSETKHPLHNLFNAHPKPPRVCSHPQHAHTLSSPSLTRQTRRVALPRRQRIRTIFEHLPELFRSLEIDLLEQLLQHRRGPGQARRRRAARQARHGRRRAACPRQPSSWDRPVSSRVLPLPLSVVGVFHLCASVLANVNVLGPVESGAAYATGGGTSGETGALGEPHRR